MVLKESIILKDTQTEPMKQQYRISMQRALHLREKAGREEDKGLRHDDSDSMLVVTRLLEVWYKESQRLARTNNVGLPGSRASAAVLAEAAFLFFITVCDYRSMGKELPACTTHVPWLHFYPLPWATASRKKACLCHPLSKFNSASFSQFRSRDCG
jgi:hypothetical protein